MLRSFGVHVRRPRAVNDRARFVDDALEFCQFLFQTPPKRMRGEEALDRADRRSPAEQLAPCAGTRIGIPMQRMGIQVSGWNPGR